MISIHPMHGIGEIAAGTDLAIPLAAAIDALGVGPELGDAVLVVTQKVVSKAEGQVRDLEAIEPGAEARALAARCGKDPRLVQLVLEESSDIVRAVPNILITRHRLGLVMANAGIDASNVGSATGERVLLLPVDPDESARTIGEALKARYGAGPAVVISDSFGRPWRRGVVNVAIGAWGLPPLWDRRGEPDRDGRLLQVTEIATADMLAAAAGLACGEADEGVPAALILGATLNGKTAPASALVRSKDEDLFQ